MIFIAHSKNRYGEEQSLQQHGVGVAEMMRTFALSDDYADVYSCCGLLHDIGKYSDGFQRYIRDGGDT